MKQIQPPDKNRPVTPGSERTFADMPVTRLSGVGHKTAAKLARIGIESVQDVLFHLPFRYEDRTRITPIGSLIPGQHAVVEGTVELAEIVFRKKRMLLCRISDGTGQLTLRFFNFNQQQKQAFDRGRRIRCFGEVKFGFSTHTPEMFHPEYQVLREDTPLPVDERLTPVYPVTEGVHQLSMRKLAAHALQLLDEEPGRMRDWIPSTLREKSGLPDLVEAVQYVHQPPAGTNLAELQEGRSPFVRRLAFEELLAQHLGLRALRLQAQKHKARVMIEESSLVRSLVQSLPFELTAAQLRVSDEISHDLQRGQAMMRLIQGDVGSGKTLVAALAALRCIESGYQAVLMAPTEILAEQHYRSFQDWFEPLGIRVTSLTGKLGAARKREALVDLASGDAAMIVGTHALFQQDVSFARLGLMIVDEQHRFGVHQRLALREKGQRNGYQVHQLIMTATPIPRTLAMTAYADLDVSVIDELPKGRQPVKTVVIPQGRRDEVIDRVYVNCIQGRQAYWVCTLIEESESLQCQAAEDTARDLREHLTDLEIGLVHGRMKASEKEKVMQAFQKGEVQLLVATTVIEVGVDVPNASLMIIENAERLGLSQLHQLRGRVGRGTAESSCVLLYQSPLSDIAKQRLEIIRDSNDGFYIAQQDLELRGPGEVLGTRQTGALMFRIADLSRDQALLPEVREAADSLLADNPEAVEPIIKRWIFRQADYANV